MKKLLFVATASLCAAVFGAIESTNVVGYQNKALEGNSYFNFVVPTFNIVDANATMKLKDIKIAYDGDGFSDQNVWTLTLGGATKQAYYYVNEASVEAAGAEVGWYADEYCTEPANDVEIPYGQGFALVSGGANNAKVVFSGAVKNGDANVQIDGGSVFVFTGNCQPKDYTLGDLALVYSGDGFSDQNIWTLTKGGATKQAYYYVNEASVEASGAEVGWYADEYCTEPANDVEINAGDGIAVVSGATIKLKVPKAY